MSILFRNSGLKLKAFVVLVLQPDTPDFQTEGVARTLQRGNLHTACTAADLGQANTCERSHVSNADRASSYKKTLQFRLRFLFLNTNAFTNVF